jgi:hypothetical protein
MTDRRNHLSPMERSDAGRMGRGEGAFSRKETQTWAKIQKRIDSIVEREQSARMHGGGVDVIHDYRHVMHSTLKAVRF